ncbi:hypothetical protein PoB_006937900 [Plakobranchus ocellatus]|uniref:Secreted protein n=1 Tax=Plakobranchus ocellatus TaxID=259542 RepID=A0AAV4DF88_9GAST|nr:hypothetical protein PoB_006937900 [Plakobranchus ocellatus]
MGMLFYLSGLVVASLFSKVNAGAWSPVYCMARRRNLRITFVAVVMATRPCRQRILFFGAVTDHLLRTKTTRSSGRTTVSRSVRQEERVLRSCEIFVLRRFCADLVRNHLP